LRMMDMKPASGTFMDWLGIISILLRPVLGTLP
jgi:hypothetical protein